MWNGRFTLFSTAKLEDCINAFFCVFTEYPIFNCALFIFYFVLINFLFFVWEPDIFPPWCIIIKKIYSILTRFAHPEKDKHIFKMRQQRMMQVDDLVMAFCLTSRPPVFADSSSVLLQCRVCILETTWQEN